MQVFEKYTFNSLSWAESTELRCKTIFGQTAWKHHKISFYLSSLDLL